MFATVQSIIKFERQKKVLNAIIAKYESEICESGEVCQDEEYGECVLQGKIIAELLDCNDGLFNTLEVCEPGKHLLLQMFINAPENLQDRDAMGPCLGKTTITILQNRVEKFQSWNDVINLAKSDHCSDGVEKTPEVCKRGWRGEMCILCPLHGI